MRKDPRSMKDLVAAYNEHAKALGERTVARFASRATALRRCEEIAARAKPAAKPASKPGKKKARSGVTFNLPARKPVAELRPGTSRAKALGLISRNGGASLDELERECGFRDRLNTVQGIRLLNYKQGVALRGDENKIELA